MPLIYLYIVRVIFTVPWSLNLRVVCYQTKIEPIFIFSKSVNSTRVR